MSRTRNVKTVERPSEFDIALKNDGTVYYQKQTLDAAKVLPQKFLYLDHTYYGSGTNGKKGKSNVQHYVTEYHLKTEQVRGYENNILKAQGTREELGEFWKNNKLSTGLYLYVMDQKGRMIRLVLTSTGLTAWREFVKKQKEAGTENLDFAIQNFTTTPKEWVDEYNLAKLMPNFEAYEEPNLAYLTKADELSEQLGDYFDQVSPVYREFAAKSTDTEKVEETVTEAPAEDVKQESEVPADDVNPFA